MKQRNGLIIAAVIGLTVLPFWLAPYLGEAGREATFAGSDDQAQQAIGRLAPDYQPWFKPLLEPASEEIASLLFALQAAIGAGVIGYWLGASVTRHKLRKEAQERVSADSAPGTTGSPAASGTPAPARIALHSAPHSAAPSTNSAPRDPAC